ncbi:response regulator transcription factor [Bizionia gelidisalsuginis]|uniref:Response regulator transcription factor n=2 Tax=Bizionia TaxID=283785 RepID=A0A8H2LEV0_9FLAO|nr:MULTISPECIES: LytTR family DNA-binding domain-containing protein [Bizionia]TYB76069.1 response regulator transcription factor [Bizionia saleffrena]TYC11363.1 response regulator transcription factor [Bizionia gelidisalsuginis]
MLKAVIVDDEPKAIEGLTWELKNYSSEIEIIKTFSIPEEALLYLKTVKPDCLFLDIQMPTMDGFQFLEHLDSKNIAIIITSAYDEYGIKALKKEVLDYLLKPVDADDLKETIAKIRKFKKRISTTDKIEDILINFTTNTNKKKITINADGKLLFINLDDILFVESDGNYSTLFLANNQKLVITKKLKEVNTLLPEDSFFRIHNSFIVNMGKIKEYIKTEGYVVMESNHRIPVARQRKSDFLEKL